MSRLTIAVQTIKDNVSAIDVGQEMGLEIRHGRCRCPIHNGGDFNCVLYKGDRGFYCHTCKAGGDVIKLVQEYYKMSFPDSVRWFNDTFRLGMGLDSPMNREAVRQAENAQRMRKEAQSFREWKARARFDLALTADQILEKLEQMRDENMPRTPGEKWNARFCEAVRLIPEARRFAEDCMADCMKGNEDETGK